MAVEIFATDNQTEINISVPELQCMIDAFGGPLMIRLFHHDLNLLVHIWDRLIGSATHIRFVVSNEVAQKLAHACICQGVETRWYCGDGGAPTQLYPRI